MTKVALSKCLRSEEFSHQSQSYAYASIMALTDEIQHSSTLAMLAQYREQRVTTIRMVASLCHLAIDIESVISARKAMESKKTGWTPNSA